MLEYFAGVATAPTLMWLLSTVIRWRARKDIGADRVVDGILVGRCQRCRHQGPLTYINRDRHASICDHCYLEEFGYTAESMRRLVRRIDRESLH